MNRMKKNYELINIMSQGLLWKKEGLALRNQELTWRAPKDKGIIKISISLKNKSGKDKYAKDKIKE